VRATLLEQSYAVDKGKDRPAGMRSDDLFTGFTSEAATTTATAAVLRKGPKGPPQDDKVPVVSFLDDLKNKLELRSVMPKRKTESVEDLDELPEGGQYEKEDVNYRYAANEAQSCGTCTHFIAPGSCEIVAGLIRTVDVCDLFDPIDDGRVSGVVQARFVPGVAEVTPPGYEPIVKALKRRPGVVNPWADAWAMHGKGIGPSSETEGVVQAEVFDPGKHPRGQGGQFGSGGGGGRVAPAKRKKGPREFRKPFVPASQMDIRQQDAQNRADAIARQRRQRREPKRMFTVQAEVAPPDWEPSVLRMKKHPEIDNPYALAWWMKGQGAQPGNYGPRGGKKTGVVLAEMVTMSSWGSSQGPSSPSTVSMVTQPAGKDTAEPAEPLYS